MTVTEPERAAVDAAAVALTERFGRTIAESLPGGWFRTFGGASAMVSGVAAPPLNAVFGTRRGAPPGPAAMLLDEVAATGLPYCFQTRDAGGAAVARARGMVPAAEIPLMVLDDPGALAGAAARAEVRPVDVGEQHLHLDLVESVFEMPPELVAPFRAAALLTRPGVRGYVATADGEVVSTAMAMTDGDHVGVYNVATPEAHRGRGYGAAVTARAVLDGLAAGASTAVLQSSDVAVGVYERLGFRTVELWTMWVPAGTASA